MKRLPFRLMTCVCGAVMTWTASTVQAHFVWIVPQSQTTDASTAPQVAPPIDVFFAESPEPGDAELLERIRTIQAWQVDTHQNPSSLKVVQLDDSLQIDRSQMDASSSEVLFAASIEYGVLQREEKPYRLVYVAKTGPDAHHGIWSKPLPVDLLPLDVQLKTERGMMVLTATVAGQPSADCEVKFLAPEQAVTEAITNEHGQASFKLASPGRYGVRVRHLDSKEGVLDGKPYSLTKIYATVTVDVSKAEVQASIDDSYKLADLPTTLTSFGAAMIDRDVYVYGGTTGGSHDYYKGVQSGALLRLSLDAKGDKPAQWETIAQGPELQGLALVSDNAKLYRIGGFEARNPQGEEGDLWSTASVECFDPSTGSWQEMPPLPEPRSSFDAAVIDHTIYVVGGWSMQGDAPRVWHNTAWKLDLRDEKPSWQSIAKPPFERRALAAASFAGKLYAIGGISSGDETVSEVEVYDPASDRWSAAPALIGEDRLTGFGASAFADDKHLYVTGVTGAVQRFAKGAATWEVVGQLITPRFFHRMLPIDPQHMLLIGGSNMSGRITKCEI